MGVRHDLETQRMGGGGDALHLGVREMRAEPAALLRQHTAGRGDLDDVGARARRLADLFGAFDGAGAGIALIEHRVDILAKARRVAVRSEEYTSEIQSLMRI